MSNYRIFKPRFFNRSYLDEAGKSEVKWIPEPNFPVYSSILDAKLDYLIRMQVLSTGITYSRKFINAQFRAHKYVKVNKI